MAHRGEPVKYARREARLGADLDRRREVLGRLDEPARRGDRRRDVRRKSTRADTTWARIWGWASPPICPVTTQGAVSPAWNSMAGRSVWSVRFPGARTFACSGSGLKYEPRFW